jgi:hypothetical protein
MVQKIFFFSLKYSLICPGRLQHMPINLTAATSLPADAFSGLRFQTDFAIAEPKENTSALHTQRLKSNNM